MKHRRADASRIRPFYFPLLHDQQNLEDLGRPRVLLPRPYIAELERTRPALFNRESKNLMPRRTGHLIIRRPELHISNLPDNRIGDRHRLPRIPGPRSRRQRYLEHVAARERELAPVVSLG